MKQKKRNRLLNILCVLLAGVIVLCGVFVVKGVKGGTKNSSGTADLLSGRTTGIVNIKRRDIQYTLDPNTALQTDDQVLTKAGATVEVSLYQTDDYAVLNENTVCEIGEDEEASLQIQMISGEAFLAMISQTRKMLLGGHELELSQAVVCLDAYEGSSQISVLDGSVQVKASDGTYEYVEAGQTLSLSDDGQDTVKMYLETLSAKSLNDFLINQALDYAQEHTLCFSREELKAVLDEREKDKQSALEKSLKITIPISTETEAQTGENDAASAEKGSEKTTEQLSEPVSERTEVSNDNQSYLGADDAAIRDEQDVDDGLIGDTTVSSGAAAGSSSTQSAASSAETYSSCTIEIRCDTILDHMDELSAGKGAYVPSNGMILSSSTVEFEEGATVFDILSRVCTYAGIPLEYSWTPLYNSYYIEGINNLYEFDCGNESGWMYKVNGWYPNYGCSAYTVKDGDVISWNYTCTGMGADLQ